MSAMESRGDRRPIAMLDSGVGGLTVLHECLVALREEDFVYFGDTARFPYGEREQHELRGFVRQAVSLLLDFDPKVIVLACNSATAAAFPDLLEELRSSRRNIVVVGVVEPEAEIATALTRCGRIGVMATPATVATQAYDRAIMAKDPRVQVTSVACARLAAVIQSGQEVDRESVDLARGYCEPLRLAGVDTVILGCTHYPLLSPMIQRIMGRDVTLVSSGHAVAAKIQRHLFRLGLQTDRRDEGNYSFLCSGDDEQFRVLGTRFLQMPLDGVRHVDVSDLESVSR